MGLGETAALILPPLRALDTTHFGFRLRLAEKESLPTPGQQAVRFASVEYLNSLEPDMEVIEIEVEYIDDSAYPITA